MPIHRRKRKTKGRKDPERRADQGFFCNLSIPLPKPIMPLLFLAGFPTDCIAPPPLALSLPTFAGGRAWSDVKKNLTLAELHP